MNICAVAGLFSAGWLSMRELALSRRISASASQSGFPQMSAPPASAAYSRVRLIAHCTIIAAGGAPTILALTPTLPSGLLRLPPQHRTKLATHQDAPGDVAV